jgi:titin
MRSPIRPRSRLVLEPLEDRLAPSTFTVTTVADAGAGSLRAAITSANAAPGADAIEFDIPGAGVRTINLTSALPTITGQLAIKGQTQPGFFTFPLIELNGTGAGAGAHGLVVNPAATGTVIRGLIINRFDGDGIRFKANNGRIEFCFIGTDGTGAVDLGNGGNGVFIFAGADNVTVGGNTIGLGNLISGNDQDGVRIEGAGTTGNRVQGNFIGTAGDGTTALANNQGVAIEAGASGNIIGGTGESAGNVISGNTFAGVWMSGAGTTGNLVRGNRVGTDRTGTLPLGNGGSGIFCFNGANSNTIGGATPGARNIISANAFTGVALVGTNANTVQGNYIGTALDGSTPLGNLQHGVGISTGSGNLIGGTTTGAANTISGNAENGVRIAGNFASANKVKGNFIGTDSTGILAVGNGICGVLIEAGANDNVIGGGIAAARNIISGNLDDGVGIMGAGTTGNVVRGNFIGTTASGTFARPNSDDGVSISDGASGNIVGGTATGSRNIISGNFSGGVQIRGAGTDGNVVQGNRIGTDKTGVLALGNLFGVACGEEASNNLIGGTTPTSRNIISGNGNAGVLISDSAGNKIQGNYIGTDKSGTVDLGNELHGVSITGASTENVVGGSTSSAGNVISGNGGDGVFINGLGTDDNRIRGNRIGLAATSTAPLGNDSHGIRLDFDPAGNEIGGTAAGTGNIISQNGGSGVFVSTGSGNAIQRNRIFDNGGLGIDLGMAGVTANDLDDPDAGANDLLNFPVLDAATLTPAGLRISGSINTEQNKIVRIEFFASPAADPTGHGEGKHYLGHILVQLLGTSSVTFSKLFAPTTVLPGQVVTATATDQAGNTSEFSLALLVD